jgi:hypothetical protein
VVPAIFSKTPCLNHRPFAEPPRYYRGDRLETKSGI